MIHDIGQVSPEPIEREAVVRVRTAKVVCANYRAIVHDFPQVFGRQARRTAPLPGCDACAASGKLCREAIDAWLIRNSAFLSRQQALPNGVNSPVDSEAEERPAFRPSGYGRALVVPVDAPAREGEAGFLDLKGAGVAPGRTPGHRPYSSGLEYLGYALADFFYGWLVDTIFARTCPGYRVLPVYAVLDLGFDIVGGWHGTAPAGLHVRRAHARPTPENALPLSGSDREKLLLHVELILRTFGLSTAGHGTSFKLSDPEGSDDLRYLGIDVELRNEAERAKAVQIAEAIRDGGGRWLEVINVQATSEADWNAKKVEIYDFGHLSAYRAFFNPVANLIRDAALNVGRIIAPAQPSFARRNDDVAVDPDLCNRDSVNAYGFYAAQRFRKGSGEWGRREIEAMLRLARLRALRRDTGWARRRVAATRDSARQRAK